MSFYFTLNTSSPFSPEVVLDVLDDTDVAFTNDVPGEWVFYKPNQSLRGVCVYQMDGKVDIGLNAFTPRIDAELMRDLAAATTTALQCQADPEDADTSLSAADILAYCDDAWLNARAAESDMMIGSIMKTSAAPLTLMGYRRAFNIAPSLFESSGPRGLPKDALIARVMEDAIALQEIDQHEDIFVPKIMQVTPTTPKRNGVFERLRALLSKQPASGPICIYTLAEGVRTLVPVSINQLGFFALLGSDVASYRKVPAQTVVEAARALGAREYGVGAFDLTLDQDAYQSLYAKGEPLSPG